MPLKFRVIYDVVFMVVRRERDGEGDPTDRYRATRCGTTSGASSGSFPCPRAASSSVARPSAFNFVLIFYTVRNSAARNWTLVNRGADRRALYPVIYRCKSISRKAMLLAIARWRMIRQTAFSAYNTPRLDPSRHRTGLCVPCDCCFAATLPASLSSTPRTSLPAASLPFLRLFSLRISLLRSTS